MMSWWRRHLMFWFGITLVPCRMPDGQIVTVRVPSDLSVYGWRVWRWTR
jgi:hypothetical protein